MDHEFYSVIKKWGDSLPGHHREHTGTKWNEAVPKGSYDLIYDHRIESLDDKIKALEQRVSEIISIIEKKPEEIVIRDINYDQAKSEIVRYFSDHHGKNIDVADIQRALKIDIYMALEVCDELEKERKIKSL